MGTGFLKLSPCLEISEAECLPLQKSFSYNGKTLYLYNGLKAEAVVFLEERPLYMWMFTPFYKISQSVSGPINE